MRVCICVLGPWASVLWGLSSPLRAKSLSQHLCVLSCPLLLGCASQNFPDVRSGPVCLGPHGHTSLSTGSPGEPQRPLVSGGQSAPGPAADGERVPVVPAPAQPFFFSCQPELKWAVRNHAWFLRLPVLRRQRCIRWPGGSQCGYGWYFQAHCQQGRELFPLASADGVSPSCEQPERPERPE